MEMKQDVIQHANVNLISLFWSKFVPYWPIFILLIGAGIGSAWLYMRMKLPVYESTATLLIKDQKKGIEDAKVMESMNLLYSKKIIENEMEVIKSKALLHQVIEELQLYAPIYEKSKWKDLPAYAISPVKIEVQSPDSLIEVNKVNLSFNMAKGIITLNGKPYPLNQWVTTPWGTLRFSDKKTGTQWIGAFYFSLIHPKRAMEELNNSLVVSSAGKLSSVIVLDLKDEVPKRSEDILNAIIDTYDKASVNDKNILADKTLSFLDDRLEFVSKNLDSIEKKLQKYKSAKGAVDISSQGKLFLQNVSDNDQKLSDINMKIAVLNQVEQHISSKESGASLVPSTLGVDDPLLSSLLTKLYDVELQYEKLKRTTGENNPELTSLAGQIEKIKPNVLENIHSQQLSLETGKRNLYATNKTYSSTLQELPQQERDLVEISREQNIKSSIYSFLLQKREEAALSHSSTVSDSRIIDKAESSFYPVGLGSNAIYIIAILLAIGTGLLLITIRELFNSKILFRQEIESLISYPIIGEIVLEKSKTPLVIEDGKASFIAEEFRMLRTSLHYLGMHSQGKKILITSTISGEGKSFVAINLAISLSLGGKKVILVEFDLSNPTLAIKLGIEGNRGIADYLSGKVEAEEVISNINNANLSIITAGNLPDNPSELILRARTEELLNYLQSKFDYVLVDSAPVGILSDGYVLSRFCDATLYVVRHGYTPKKMLERLEQNNKINELKNLAIVFNGVQSRGFGLHKYGYGYGYGYLYNQRKRAYS